MHLFNRKCDTLTQEAGQPEIEYTLLSVTSGWYRSRDSPSLLFSGKGVLKICSKFTREHPCQSVVSIATLLKSLYAMRVFL